jgi:hypothetical protein
MKIELTAQDYLDLLDILHIADVIMSGHRREEDSRSSRHRALVQKLYGLSRGEGFERLMGYDESAKRHIPTVEFEENSVAHTLIDEFGSHLFWDELINKLSERDAAQQAGGMENLAAMSDSERQDLEGPIRQRYIEEFSENGIANLAVVQRFAGGGAMPVKTSD